MSETPPEHAHPHKSRFSFSTLTKTKVAGVPVIYILLIVAAVGLFIALRMKRSTADVPATESDPESFDGDAGLVLPEVDNPQFEANPQGGSVSSSGSGDSGVPDPVDGDGGDLVPSPTPPGDSGSVDDSPTVVGGSDTPSTPPPPPPPPPVAAPRPRKQGTPGCYHTVETGQDNGPGDLALLYYGKNNAQVVAGIEAHNTEKAKDGAGHWPIGTKLWIPPDEPPKYFKATSTVRSAPDIAAKNGLSGGGPEVKAYNPGMNFPVAVGTNVRIH